MKRISFLRSPAIIFCIVSMTVVLALSSLPAHSAQAAEPAYVRIIHASPDIGTADVFVDGSKLLSNFQFGTVTNYVSVPPGPHDVKVALIGKGPGAATISQTLNVEPATSYTVAALGTQSKGFSLKVFVDDNSIANGMTKLRIYDLSPDTDLSTVTTQGNVIASGISYQQSSDYLTLQPHSYTFTFNGENGDLTQPLAMDLSQDTVASIFAVGLHTGTPKLQLISTEVKALPAMPGTGSDPTAAPLPGTIQSVSLWPVVMLLLVEIVFSMLAAGAFTRFVLHRK